jgi:hypothetical protein
MNTHNKLSTDVVRRLGIQVARLSGFGHNKQLEFTNPEASGR